MDPRPAARDEEKTQAHATDAAAESFRTASAIFSMMSLVPMHVSGAYRAGPLPASLLAKNKKK